MNDVKKSRLLLEARAVFLRHGYKRVTMSDIAEAAGMSRAALYVGFKNKEDVFVGVFDQWVDQTIAEIVKVIASAATAAKKLELAFEIWAVKPFEMTMDSPEAKELLECSFDFAFVSLKRGYAKFERAVAPVIATLAEKRLAHANISPARTAHVLASAVRGFKQTAAKPAELRQLIKQLLLLSLTI
jgi:TetR/AcrR family transcriptional regulator, regulator of autoinduction and epiphytic fitness